jgi:hypothetical protein
MSGMTYLQPWENERVCGLSRSPATRTMPSSKRLFGFADGQSFSSEKEPLALPSP